MRMDGSASEVHFLKTELKTGMTFARIAATAKHRKRRDRNLANARKAYDTAREYLQKLTFTPETSSQLHELERLRHQLVELGESV